MTSAAESGDLPSWPNTFHARLVANQNRLEDSPTILDLSGAGAALIAQELLRSHPDAACLDLAGPAVEVLLTRMFGKQSAGLSGQEYRQFADDKLKSLGCDSLSPATLAYFPISNVIIQYAADAIHYKARTISNLGLTTEHEQSVFQTQVRVGFAGLSVGLAAALTAAREGFRMIKGIDADRLSLENLNRVPAPVTMVGATKAAVAHELILMADPYSELLFTAEKLDSETIYPFMLEPKLDIVVDAVDDPSAKDLLRKTAKEHRIAVLMTSDLGDGCILVDVEDYRKHPNIEPYHGVAQSMRMDQNAWSTLPPHVKIAATIGPENAPLRMIEAFIEVLNSNLPSWPQLALTVNKAAAATTYILKRLALGEEVPPRTRLDFSQAFDPNYDQSKAVALSAAAELAHTLGIATT